MCISISGSGTGYVAMANYNTFLHHPIKNRVSTDLCVLHIYLLIKDEAVAGRNPLLLRHVVLESYYHGLHKRCEMGHVPCLQA